MQFPNTAAELLDEIERMVPERVPETDDTMEAIQRYAGKRELVLLLRHMQAALKRDPVVPRRRR